MNRVGGAGRGTRDERIGMGGAGRKGGRDEGMGVGGW